MKNFLLLRVETVWEWHCLLSEALISSVGDLGTYQIILKLLNMCPSWRKYDSKAPIFAAWVYFCAC